MTFIKKTENFICRNCGAKIAGNGYTNHCPICLWSKHVDEEIPGDRKSTCKGLMEPIGVELKNGGQILIHQCLKCGKKSKNKTAPNDNFEILLKLS